VVNILLICFYTGFVLV